MFNSLNNKPEDVRRALVETAKLAEKLKAKKDKLVIKTYIEDDECKTECGQCLLMSQSQIQSSMVILVRVMR